MKGRSPGRFVGTPGFSTSMICSQDVCLNEVAELSHAFKWNRPKCECGGLRVWGHGRVGRYFEGFSEPLLVQRFRCADCKTVFTCRPKGWWARFVASATTVIRVLLSRFTDRRWPATVPRQRAEHWLRRFNTNRLFDPGPVDEASFLRACLAGGGPPFSIEGANRLA
jgi:transposase-like protein